MFDEPDTRPAIATPRAFVYALLGSIATYGVAAWSVVGTLFPVHS